MGIYATALTSGSGTASQVKLGGIILLICLAAQVATLHQDRLWRGGACQGGKRAARIRVPAQLPTDAIAAAAVHWTCAHLCATTLLAPPAASVLRHLHVAGCLGAPPPRVSWVGRLPQASG